MPKTAIPIFIDVAQQYDGTQFTNIAQDLDIAYSLQRIGANVIPYKIYNNHSDTVGINITFRILAYNS